MFSCLFHNTFAFPFSKSFPAFFRIKKFRNNQKPLPMTHHVATDNQKKDKERSNRRHQLTRKSHGPIPMLLN
ncbi:hypothetical protein B9Z55_027507 [Caenorhabditis nigoni]|uniref:Uncharacterized protein n=1 Tax=Caenorhabditis nigoni TaxID=1611254 RepID=A0A2G5SFT4_9PELO|nr:hypothetical protein B9Z55_027507 [Caenorhabditis nigoni]